MNPCCPNCGERDPGGTHFDFAAHLWNCTSAPKAPPQPRPSFQAELEKLINMHSMENGSNTPDFILAQYLAACLEAFNAAVTRRDKWYRPKDEDAEQAD